MEQVESLGKMRDRNFVIENYLEKKNIFKISTHLIQFFIRQFDSSGTCSLWKVPMAAGVQIELLQLLYV